MVWEAKGDEKLVDDGLVIFEAPRMVHSVLGAFGRRAAASPVACLSGIVNLTCEAVDDMAHGSRLRGLIRSQEHATSSWTNSPI